MKKMLVIMSILASIIAILLIYEYPIQRAVAMNKFYKYIELQGASKENIVDMEVFKDYKMGGYKIRVIYKDDKPDNIYWYHYDAIKIYWDCIYKDRISLYISYHGLGYDSDSGNNGEWNIKNGIKVKYPPLKDYR